MASETIGFVAHHCGNSAHVRKDKNGKLYGVCSHCGQQKYNLQGGQDYLLNNVFMLDSSGELSQRDSEVLEKSLLLIKDFNINLESLRAESVVKNPVNVTEKPRYETEKKTISKKPVSEPLTEKPVIPKPVEGSGIGNMSL